MINKFQIQNNANDLREDLNLQENDIVQDIPELIRSIGYKYNEQDLGYGYSGSSKLLSSCNFEICFNSQNHTWGKNYKRFTLAHELGHIRIPSHIEILKNGLLHRSKADYNSTDTVEKEADYFAISFLAQKNSFQKQMLNTNFSSETIIELANHYGISLHSALLRYLELTNNSLSAIIINKKDKKIEYEHRSDLFYKKADYKYRDTLDSIDCISFTGTKTICLNEWYQEFNDEIEAIVSILNLGYNNKFALLIEPFDNDLENYINLSD